LTFSGN